MLTQKGSSVLWQNRVLYLCFFVQLRHNLARCCILQRQCWVYIIYPGISWYARDFYCAKTVLRSFLVFFLSVWKVPRISYICMKKTSEMPGSSRTSITLSCQVVYGKPFFFYQSTYRNVNAWTFLDRPKADFMFHGQWCVENERKIVLEKSP